MANVEQTTKLQPAARSVPDCGAAPGDMLGKRYHLDAVIGYGGQAVVFRARDSAHADAPIALKVARRDLDPAGCNEAAAVLRWEGGLLRRLRHPALPRFQQLHSSPQATWLARELVPGTPLLQTARHGPQSQRQVGLWAVQLCDLLSALHTQAVPVVCGDLKPANLVLRPDGTLCLIDLGAAATLTRRPPRVPRPRHGTPGYAPPEQLAGRGYDERADLFALAVMCYELLTSLDPALAPLQFDLDRLDRLAPQFAPALRWALELEAARRCPTAAALRSQLGSPLPARPLVLGFGVALAQQRDLAVLVERNPDLLAPVVADGRLERWLAAHPDATLGALRYRLRAAMRAAPPRQNPLHTLLGAMAPAEGSPLLRFDPPQLVFGDIPLRSWRIWSRAQSLSLRNEALTPLRWQLSSPTQPDAELRIRIDGKMQRQLAGVLAPGDRVRLELTAMGLAGPRGGTLQLHCGTHSWAIPWQGVARAGAPVGQRHVARLEDLDVMRDDLVPALEALLVQGALARWLRATGQRALAQELDAAMTHKPDELQRRLLVSRVLHPLSPARFPLFGLVGVERFAARPFKAGEPVYNMLELENRGLAPCPLLVRSRCAWAQVAAAPSVLAPKSISRVSLRLQPPRAMRGAQSVALELMVGALPLTIVLPVQIAGERWWQRIGRLLGG